MAFKPTCKQAAALLIAAEDRAIGLGDADALRLHILACKACDNFEQQLLVMRKALKQWRNYADNDRAEEEPS